MSDKFKGSFVYELMPLDFFGYCVHPFEEIFDKLVLGGTYARDCFDSLENVDVSNTDVNYVQNKIKHARSLFEKYTYLPKGEGDVYIGEIPNGEDGVELFIVIKNSRKGGNGCTVLYTPFEFSWLKEYEKYRSVDGEI